MPQAGAHAIIGFYGSRFIKSKKGFISGTVMGSFLPDIDIFMVAFSFIFLDVLDPEHYFHRKATHSLFFIVFVYLLFQIIGELRSSISIQYWGKGLAFGIFLHILADSFLFLHGIQPLWPLTLEWNLWKYYSPLPMINNILLSLEFLFFRILAWILIQFSIHADSIEHNWFLPWLTSWQKIELSLFIFFLGLTFLKISWFNIIFSIFYLPSLTMAIISVWLMKDVLESQLSIKIKG